MDAGVHVAGHLGIDDADQSKAGQATERGLDMPAGAPEPIVEVEVPEGGIEVVMRNQNHGAAAEPDAFGVAGRAVDGLGRLGEFVGLALGILGGLRGGGWLGLVVGMVFPALGEGTAARKQQDSNGNSEMPQKPELGLKHPPTHKFPDSPAAPGILPPLNRLMAAN